ncbi:redox-regulated ATPase YchF [Candidatus Berkelbacteria bacterium]|nr:redox-regulated ATPase YchF [Candidatus Berkelbacteria bacterium]
MLQIGIVGLPNVGKSTLFNALIKKQAAEAHNFPFTTIEPNIGIVSVPDERLTVLATIVKPKQIVPAIVTFVDIAGIVRGAHTGEGLGNQFLTNIRDVDAIALVLRDFTDPNVTHVAGSVNALEDADTIQTELALKDLETVTKRIDSVSGKARSGEKEAVALLPLLEKAKTTLEQGRGVCSLPFSSEQKILLKELQLLTDKPVLYVLNVDEQALGRAGERVEELRGMSALIASSPTLSVSAKIEAELAVLDETEQAEYLTELGITEPGLNRLIREAFTALGLATYFTAGPQEVRAWTIRQGMIAPQAAGVIHTDFERGFIRAEVISYADYIACGSELSARDAGKLRSEGKDYIVQDGDIIHFRFNV